MVLRGTCRSGARPLLCGQLSGLRSPRSGRLEFGVLTAAKQALRGRGTALGSRPGEQRRVFF